MRCRPINRAYFKLCEMRRLIPSEVSSALLLCEAPGGFYQAARTMFPTATRMVATSLATADSLTFHESVLPDVLAGLPSQGDIRRPDVADAIVARLGANSFDLVTADGGIDHDDLDMVEQGSLHLLVGQVVAALRLTRVGGSCVIKVFEGSVQATRDVVAILRRLFANTHVYKPRTSKAANSERYLICNGLVETARATTAAAELTRVLLVPYPLALLERPDEQIAKAFDALSAKQTHELHRLVSSAADDVDARTEVEELVRKDAAWIQQHVPCLDGPRGPCTVQRPGRPRRPPRPNLH